MRKIADPFQHRWRSWSGDCLLGDLQTKWYCAHNLGGNYTDRKLPEAIVPAAKGLGMVQELKLEEDTFPKVDNQFRTQKMKKEIRSER